MSKPFVMLDLCSGLGGASEAMVQSPDWFVVRVDSDPGGVLQNDWPPFTHKKCVKELGEDFLYQVRHFKSGDLTLLWASPPCRHFSRAFSAPGPTALRNGQIFEPDMSILEAVIDLKEKWKPKFYCIENVVGAIPYFQPLLGPPTQIIGPFVLWHNLPTIAVDYSFTHLKSDNDVWSNNPLRSNLLAKIPIEISTAVMQAASSPTLGDFV